MNLSILNIQVITGSNLVMHLINFKHAKEQFLGVWQLSFRRSDRQGIGRFKHSAVACLYLFSFFQRSKLENKTILYQLQRICKRRLFGDFVKVCSCWNCKCFYIRWINFNSLSKKVLLRQIVIKKKKRWRSESSEFFY